MSLMEKLRARLRQNNAPEPPSQMTGLRDSVLRGWFNKAAGELFTGFPVGPGDVLVDVGCGLGAHSQFCAELGARVILVDADPKRVAQATARLKSLPGSPLVESHVSECNPLPIPDGTATRVLCTEVIEHVESPAILMSEMARIGRPGALYLFTCPDPQSEALQKRLAPPSYFESPNHVRILTHDEFARYVEEAGLVIESRHSYGFFWSIWLAFFWTTGIPLEEASEKSFQFPGQPVLDNWLRTWQSLLDQPNGNAVKQALDDLMPKSQVILARKP
jgi:2-polyprenyl-3-methyl-5-hydroxy-6-metoxy-1,4-benzoquinol methylase